MAVSVLMNSRRESRIRFSNPCRAFWMASLRFGQVEIGLASLRSACNLPIVEYSSSLRPVASQLGRPLPRRNRALGLRVIEDACSSTAGECILRVASRNDATGMPRSHDYSQPSPAAYDHSGKKFTLQPRPPALQLRARNAGSDIGATVSHASQPL